MAMTDKYATDMMKGYLDKMGMGYGKGRKTKSKGKKGKKGKK